jgi:hypothetical protein
MTPLVLLASIAVLFLVFLTLQLWWRYSRRIVQQSVPQLTPIDLDAFQNLTDPEEDRFLMANLAPAQFREAQRYRIQAAKMYVVALSENAGILVAAGQSARYHADPAIAAMGLEIFQRAIKLKIWCMFALVRLNVALIYPARLSPSGGIANQYQRVTYIAANLGRAGRVA